MPFKFIYKFICYWWYNKLNSNYKFHLSKFWYIKRLKFKQYFLLKPHRYVNRKKVYETHQFYWNMHVDLRFTYIPYALQLLYKFILSSWSKLKSFLKFYHTAHQNVHLYPHKTYALMNIFSVFLLAIRRPKHECFRRA